MREIAIRTIQHYLYCPHRWGLLEMEDAWSENAFVASANLIHERAHDPARHDQRGVLTFTAVQVFCDRPEYGMYGVLDCLEARKSPSGISLDGLEGRYKLTVVEYKPTKPKSEDFHPSDLYQVLAQKICVDTMFQTDCDAVIYYADVKRRQELPIRDNFAALDQKLRQTLSQMRDALERGTVPEILPGQKCSGCSIKDFCLPAKKRSFESVKNRIMKELENED